MRICCFVAVIAVSQVAAQAPSAFLKSPYGPANRVLSPDGDYALFGIYETSQLWLEDTHAHQRKLAFGVTIQTLTLAWSPDSAAFIANDRFVSDVENAYIFDVKTLDRLDLGSRIIAAADAGAACFLPGENQHSYFHAIRWLDARHVEVQLHGHTDGTWNKNSVRPGDCFDLRYRVGRDGAVQKLSQRVASLDSKACDTME
jgi:hypothetical protein